MKKKLAIFGFIAAITLITMVSASNIEPLTAYVAQFRVFVNGDEQNFENPIVTINGRTYIPLRELGEVLGMDVGWDGENHEINISSSQMLTFPIDNDEYKTLYRFERNGLWGFMDANNTEIIKPQFIVAQGFSEGLAFVIDEAWQRGYIDLEGKFVISFPEVFYPQDFSNGFARVVLREWDWGSEIIPTVGGMRGPVVFIDRTGENIFGLEFASADPFNEEGIARVSLIDGITQTYIDREGNIVGSSD